MAAQAEASTRAAGKEEEGEDATKITVAVDLDEVIGQFVPELAKMHNDRFGSKHTAADYFSYEFHNVWGCSKDVCMDRVEMFLESYIPSLPVIEGAQAALKRLKASGRFRFVLVTSRQSSIEAETRAWLDKHYAGLFDAVVLGNHYGRSGAKRSKAEMCIELGVHVLIDDRVKYARATHHAVQHVCLFGTYAWNKLSETDEAALPDNVHRTPSWDEVETKLNEWYVAATKEAEASA